MHLTRAAAEGVPVGIDVIEQITTLLQKLKAKGEKDVNAAISGKMSPAVGKAYAGSAAY